MVQVSKFTRFGKIVKTEDNAVVEYNGEQVRATKLVVRARVSFTREYQLWHFYVLGWIPGYGKGEQFWLSSDKRFAKASIAAEIIHKVLVSKSSFGVLDRALEKMGVVDEYGDATEDE
jgi:hypothetical protein